MISLKMAIFGTFTSRIRSRASSGSFNGFESCPRCSPSAAEAHTATYTEASGDHKVPPTTYAWAAGTLASDGADVVLGLTTWLYYFDWSELQWLPLPGPLAYDYLSGDRIFFAGTLSVGQYLGINCRRIFSWHEKYHHGRTLTITWSPARCY